MQPTYSCLIVEDEYPAQLLLKAYIGQLPSLHLVACCDNALQALDVLRNEPIDLLFLDINLPGLSGIDFLKSLSQRPFVIFITAYSEYAITSYELDIVDYLLKPVSFERFVQAVNKSVERLVLKNIAAQTLALSLQKPIAAPPDLPVKDYFFVKADYKSVKVKFDELLYIEGLREYVSIYTNSGRIITLESLRNLETILPSDKFMRVHKSYIVAIHQVKAVAGNELELGNKKSIPIGKSYREQVLAVFR